jgi:hypothetical protein
LDGNVGFRKSFVHQYSEVPIAHHGVAACGTAGAGGAALSVGRCVEAGVAVAVALVAETRVRGGQAARRGAVEAAHEDLYPQVTSR